MFTERSPKDSSLIGFLKVGDRLAVSRVCEETGSMVGLMKLDPILKGVNGIRVNYISVIFLMGGRLRNFTFDSVHYSLDLCLNISAKFLLICVLERFTDFVGSLESFELTELSLLLVLSI